MRALATALGIAAAMASAYAQGADNEREPAQTTGTDATWSGSAVGYWNMPRGDSSYLTGIFGVNRGPLHLEARANYEARHAWSAFVGWNLSGGESLSYTITPILGFVTGSVHGPIAGFESSLAFRKFDYYIEVEYLHEPSGEESSYVYAWSELGYRPIEWLRLGLVAQRTRAYGGSRDYQGGGFVQLTYGKATAGFYWFNPGSTTQIAIVSLGISF